ncbi:hypothetical protein EJB05_35294, partial [Eragrostis curvula]
MATNDHDHHQLAFLSMVQDSTGNSKGIGIPSPRECLEWIVHCDVKTEIYGIVLLLEIVMGTRVSSQTKQDGQPLELRDIVEILEQVLASGEPSHIVDTKLQGLPTMDSIVAELMSCKEDNDQPLQIPNTIKST